MDIGPMQGYRIQPNKRQCKRGIQDSQMPNKNLPSTGNNGGGQRWEDVGKERGMADIWREYCLELYNHTSQTDPYILDSLRNTQKQVEEPPIIREEVEEAIRRLKSGKASGIDNIPVEILRYGGKSAIDVGYSISYAVK